MKKIIIPAIAVLTMIACANTPPSDNEANSNPLPAEYTGTGKMTFRFEQGTEGKIPNGFTQTATGKMQKLDWRIVNDHGNKVAAQSAPNDGEYFNLLVLNEPVFKDLSMTVRIKAIAGNEDQGGGLMWRYIDNNNYYIARYNPLESNFRFYRVVEGNRKQLKSAKSDVKQGEWCTMTIEMKGNTITCYLNNRKLIETTDDTFKKAGRVGLWTKADAQTYFDNLEINPTD